MRSDENIDAVAMLQTNDNMGHVTRKTGGVDEASK